MSDTAAKNPYSMLKNCLVATLALSLAFPINPLAAAQAGLDIQAQAMLDDLQRQRRVALAVLDDVDPGLIDVDRLALDLAFEEAEGIVEFVASTMRYEAYAGLLRGPQGTLIAGAGNALDQSILLARLLNDAGYEARVALGTLNDADAWRLVRSMFDATAEAPELAVGAGDIDHLTELFGIDRSEVERAVTDLIEFDLVATTDYQTAVEAQRTIVSSLAAAGLALGTDMTDLLIGEARDYAWVEYRLSPSDAWTGAHPAFGLAEAPVVEAIDHLSSVVPAELTHRLRIEVTVERKLGDRLETAQIMEPWEAPAANLFGLRLSVGNTPYGLDPALRVSELGTALMDQTFYAPTLNGALPPGAQVFDLLGNVVPPDAAASVAAALIQTEAERVGRAATALGNLGADEESSTEAVALTAQWIDFTLVSPGGREKSHRRFVFDRLTAESRATGGVELQDREVLLNGILTQYDFMVVGGGLSGEFMAHEMGSQVLRYLDVVEAATRLSGEADAEAKELALSEAVRGLDVRAQLSLVAQFDSVGTNGAELAYRAEPTIVALWQAITPTATVGYQVGVDIVNNRRRFLRLEGETVASSPERAILAGAWETVTERGYVEGMADGSRVQGALSAFAAAPGPATVLLPGDTAALSSLAVPAVVLPALRRDLAAGFALVLPGGPLPEGVAWAWWRVDPLSGEALGVGESGRGVATIEMTVTNVALLIIGGVALGLVASSFLEPCYSLTGSAYTTCLCQAIAKLGAATGLVAGIGIMILKTAVVVSLVTMIGSAVVGTGMHNKGCLGGSASGGGSELDGLATAVAGVVCHAT